MYRSVVPAIVPDVAPTTLISVGGVATSFVTATPTCPAGHTRDTHAAALLAPAADNVPAGHVTHAAEEFAPVAVEYVPAGQLTHALAPVTPEYVPAGQFAHTADAFAPVTPEYFPAGQARQSDVLFTQLFSCADAWAKTSFDRCVFQT